MSKHEDADLILKLYDLRREATMREARNWMFSFNPTSAQDVIDVLLSEHSGHYRMVIADPGRARLVLAGSQPRLASPGLVETASRLVLQQTGSRPRRPTGFAQLLDLAFPYTLHAQGPLLAHGMPALTLTSGGERPPAAFTDRPNRLDAIRLGELGGAAQQLLRWLDSGVELAPGTASYVYFGPGSSRAGRSSSS